MGKIENFQVIIGARATCKGEREYVWDVTINFDRYQKICTKRHSICKIAIINFVKNQFSINCSLLWSKLAIKIYVIFQFTIGKNQIKGKVPFNFRFRCAFGRWCLKLSCSY